VRERVGWLRYLVLDHGGSLSTEHLDRLEHVDDALISHSLEDDTQSDENASPTDTSASHTHTHTHTHLQITSTDHIQPKTNPNPNLALTSYTGQEFQSTP